MQTRRLGRTGADVTILGYGAMELRCQPHGPAISDDDAADGCLFGAHRHLDDHRQPANIGERLARKPGGSHPRRDQYEHTV